jgi:hypothetical protein
MTLDARRRLRAPPFPSIRAHAWAQMPAAMLSR